MISNIDTIFSDFSHRLEAHKNSSLVCPHCSKVFNGFLVNKFNRHVQVFSVLLSYRLYWHFLEANGKIPACVNGLRESSQSVAHRSCWCRPNYFTDFNRNGVPENQNSINANSSEKTRIT